MNLTISKYCILDMMILFYHHLSDNYVNLLDLLDVCSYFFLLFFHCLIWLSNTCSFVTFLRSEAGEKIISEKLIRKYSLIGRQTIFPHRCQKTKYLGRGRLTGKIGTFVIFIWHSQKCNGRRRRWKHWNLSFNPLVFTQWI